MAKPVTKLQWPLRYIPQIEKAGRFAMPVQQFNFLYRHDTCAVHLHDYPGVIDLAGIRYVIRPGDLTFSHPDRPSSYEVRVAGRHWCIHFQPAVAAEPLLNLPLHVSLGSQRGYVQEQMARIATLCAQGKGGMGQLALGQAAAGLVLQELLIWLAGYTLEKSGVGRVCRSPEKVDALAADICQRLEEVLSIPELCRRAGLSRNYMSRQFRQRQGLTIARYILTQRLRYGRSLVEGSDMPIGTIGAMVGMPDPRHFNKQFRRFYGAAPSAIRAAAQQRRRKVVRPVAATASRSHNK